MERRNKRTKNGLLAFVFVFLTGTFSVAAQPALVERAEEKAERLEASSEARRDLVITVHSVIERRISTNFLGYEQGKSFIGNLDIVLKSFAVALEKNNKESRSIAFASPELRDLTLSAFSANEADFQKFYSSVLSKDPILQSKSSSEIKEAMFLFSALMYSSDREVWRSTSKSSYFWPACRKRE